MSKYCPESLILSKTGSKADDFREGPGSLSFMRTIKYILTSIFESFLGGSALVYAKKAMSRETKQKEDYGILLVKSVLGKQTGILKVLERGGGSEKSSSFMLKRK